MKTYWLTHTDDTHTATYYIDAEGDILDTKAEANLLGCVAEVIVHGMYVGSTDDMRKAALEKYRKATN